MLVPFWSINLTQLFFLCPILGSDNGIGYVCSRLHLLYLTYTPHDFQSDLKKKKKGLKIIYQQGFYDFKFLYFFP